MPLDHLQIVIFGLFSGWGWAFLLAAQCLLLVVVAKRHRVLHTGVMSGLFVVIAMQAVIAATAAVLTDADTLSMFTCLSGAFGILLVPVASLVEIAIFLVLRRRRWVGVAGSWRDAAMPIAVWWMLKSTTWIVVVRSGMLCTV